MKRNFMASTALIFGVRCLVSAFAFRLSQCTLKAATRRRTAKRSANVRNLTSAIRDATNTELDDLQPRRGGNIRSGLQAVDPRKTIAVSSEFDHFNSKNLRETMNGDRKIYVLAIGKAALTRGYWSCQVFTID